METLLQGLDAIDWARIPTDRTLAGEPALIPGLLRRLENADDGEAGSVVGDLEAVLFHTHSGCWTAPAASVVPFLTLLCGSPRDAVVRAALSLLADLAAAEPYATEDRSALRRARAALLAGRPVYYALLDSPTAGTRTRIAVLELLSVVDHGSPRFADALARACRSDQPDRLRRAAQDLTTTPGQGYHDTGFGASVPL